jgi:hypothetical protein
VLCHELWHAWRYRFAPERPGDAASEEALADLAGIAMTQLAADLFGGVPPLDTGLTYLDEPALTPSVAYLDGEPDPQGAPGESPQSLASNTVCAALLEAKLAAATSASDAAAALDRLDSLIRSGAGGQRNGPPVAFTLSPAYVRSTIGISPCGFEDFVNLEIARLRERQGDLRAALDAVRRRPYAYHLSDYLAPHLREEGRLAALTGDTTAAIRAYRHYLALRTDPEPALRPAVEAVRAELAKLASS